MAVTLPEAETANSSVSTQRLRITVLGSGSSGNAILVQADSTIQAESRLRAASTAFLIDAGLSAKRLCAALQQHHIEPDTLAGIALTHEHGDHAGGLRTLCKRRTIPLFATRMTAEAIAFQWKIQIPGWRFFASGQTFSIADVPVLAFSVPHDAADPVGFLVGPADSRAAILTDLGMVTRSVVEAIRGVRVLCLETNYDEELLDLDTKRPWAVKQRIAARHGHLSNRAAAELVREVAGPALHTVVLGHLSEDCNHPDRAISAVRTALDAVGCGSVRVLCAPRNEPLETIAV